MHSICKHQRLLHLSLPWSRFPLNTTLGNKETRSSNLCSEIKHWLSNAQVLQARLWGWFDPALRWWKIRRILPNHMPEPVQLHSNSRSNHRGGLHRSSLNWDLAPSTSLAVEVLHILRHIENLCSPAITLKGSLLEQQSPKPWAAGRYWSVSHLVSAHKGRIIKFC